MPQPSWTDQRSKLLRQLERIRPDTNAYADVRPPTAPGLERTPDHARIAAPAERQSFGRWLLTQCDRDGLVGVLARSATADRDFPRDGDAEALRARLRGLMAEGDMFEAVDDAELDWLSY